MVTSLKQQYLRFGNNELATSSERKLLLVGSLLTTSTYHTVPSTKPTVHNTSGRTEHLSFIQENYSMSLRVENANRSRNLFSSRVNNNGV